MANKYKTQPRNGSSKIVDGCRVVRIKNGLKCQGTNSRLYFSDRDIADLSDNHYVSKIDVDRENGTLDIRFTNRYYVDSVLMIYGGINRHVIVSKLGFSNRLISKALNKDFNAFMKEYASNSTDTWISSIRSKVDVKMSMV